MAILPKSIYMFNAISIKFSHREKIYPKVHLETQKTFNSQGIMSIKGNPGDITIPDFKIYFRVIATKTV
jgi:hypothetical protein